MTLLTDSTIINISSGDHQITYEMTVGTAKLQMSIDGLEFQDIPDSSSSASTIKMIKTAQGSIRAVLTGNAVASIVRVQV